MMAPRQLTRRCTGGGRPGTWGVGPAGRASRSLRRSSDRRGVGQARQQRPVVVQDLHDEAVQTHGDPLPGQVVADGGQDREPAVQPIGVGLLLRRADEGLVDQILGQVLRGVADGPLGVLGAALDALTSTVPRQARRAGVASSLDSNATVSSQCVSGSRVLGST
jgi:hypothetical protein